MAWLRVLVRNPLCGSAVAAALVALLLVGVWPREPVYHQHPLHFWLAELPTTLCSTHGQLDVVETQPVLGRVWVSPKENEINQAIGEAASGVPEASRAITSLNRQCLPTLVAGLQLRIRRQSSLVKLFADCTESIHLRVLDPLPQDYEVLVKRGQAVTALLLLGQQAHPALPKVLALAKFDSDPGVRASALEVLRQLSPAQYGQLKREDSREQPIRR